MSIRMTGSAGRLSAALVFGLLCGVVAPIACSESEEASKTDRSAIRKKLAEDAEPNSAGGKPKPIRARGTPDQGKSIKGRLFQD